MKNWLKENWFKLLAGLGILAIASSFVYYFLVFMPHKEEYNKERVRQAQLADQQNKCKEIGDKIYKDDAKKYQEMGGYSFEPTYKFNENLNKCLYSGGGYTGAYSWERFVKDTLTNQNLAASSNFDARQVASDQEKKLFDDYWKTESSLME